MARADPFANPEEAVRRVYAYAAYRLGDGVEAEDVTSATIERALRYRSTYDAGKGDPAAWLIGIARRTIDDHYRRQALAETVATVPDRPGDPFEDRTVERLAMAAAVGRLDPRERELVALRYGADLTARQIADLLGQRTNTIEVALHRALGRLRAAVEQTDVAPPVRKPGSEPVEGI
jgi:RNA polymerase sigma-70 factor (ECF subfamily)